MHYSLSASAILIMCSVVACSLGPTKRYTDGKWNVSENICSSNPDKPNLGDMRSEIRSHASYETSFERKITFFYLDRTILDVTQNINRTSRSGEMVLYEDSSDNPVVKTVKFFNTRELNNAIKDGMEDFFANNPTIDGSDVESFCLYRGQ